MAHLPLGVCIGADCCRNSFPSLEDLLGREGPFSATTDLIAEIRKIISGRQIIGHSDLSLVLIKENE